MKTREAYYPYEGGGEFVEFLLPIKRKIRKVDPIEKVYQPIPQIARIPFANLVKNLHRTKENFLECWDIATHQVYDEYVRFQVELSQLSREIYIPC
jgi:hypothetical protein